jgi:hypothetical protein
VPVNNSINTGSKNGKKKDGPKVSNLFKPKQVLDAISAKGSANVSDDRGGCDWSYGIYIFLFGEILKIYIHESFIIFFITGVIKRRS